MTDYPYLSRPRNGTFLGGLAGNALEPSPLSYLPDLYPRGLIGGSFLGRLAAGGLLEPPLPPVSLPNILLANKLLGPPVSSADAYLRQILRREAVDTSPTSPLRQVQAKVWPIIWSWANGHLLSVEPSGSFSKGTANASSTDIDLFISVSPNAAESLREMYDKLERKFQQAGYVTRRQNVSINITVDGQSVDLVPGKKHNFLLDDHSLYRRKADSWTKTNVAAHAETVTSSGRIDEIRIAKLWRDQWSLDFPSFYLELTVLRALGYLSPYGDLAANVWKVLTFLRDDFLTARTIDPANSNNIISEDLSVEEKRRVGAYAAQSLSAQFWEHVVR
jgi:hypothetical protein